MIENLGIIYNFDVKWENPHNKISNELCKNASTDYKDVYASYLQLDSIKAETSLDDLINIRLGETLEGPYECSKCKKKDIKMRKKEIIKQWPNTLIIMLPRFLMNNRGEKIKHQGITEFSSILEKGGKNYILKAVINHKGSSLNFGHYTAIVRNNVGKWYEKNDETTYLFAENDSEFDKNIKKLDTNYRTTYTQQAYILIYEKL